MSEAIDYEKKYKKLIIALSVVIPLAVAALFGIKIEGVNTKFLPPIYAGINGLTAFFLIVALILIKQKRIKAHEKVMKLNIVLSCLFLLMYVAYHMTNDSTHYGGPDAARRLYFIILISHIALSVAIIPLVLFTYVKAWSGKYAAHRKLARITFPIWLYVAISGVLVYLMISPYYS